jgi:MYXO-CTERM domain-containing protein
MVGVDERVWVRDLLVHNYGLRKNGNHAPLGIYLHPGWISSYPARVAGLRDFLTMALASGDTWMVTNHSLVQFVQAPQTAAQLTTWAGVSCPVRRVDCESLMGGGGQDASFPDAAPPVDSGVPPDSGLSPDSGGSGDSGHSTDSGVSPPSADAAAATDAAPIYARPIVRTDGCGCRSTPSTAFAEPALLLLLALAATRRKRG